MFRKWCIYSEYTKLRILFYHFKGLKAPTIARYLQAENIYCARQNVAIFIKKYRQTKSICRRSGSGRPSKLTAEVKAIVEEEMRKDDERLRTSCTNCFCHAGTELASAPFYAAGPPLDGRFVEARIAN